MNLFRIMFAEHRLRMVLVVLSSAASAAFSVEVLDFINARLLGSSGITGAALAEYAGLLVLLFVLGVLSQIAASTLGHRLVYQLRRTFVKRVLDTSVERLELVGAARILACLSGDTSRLTASFSVLPMLVYGLLLALAGLGYLAWLSPRLFAATVAWVGLTVAVGAALLRRMDRHMRSMRELDDRLIGDYQVVIEGRNELTLNRARARRIYERELDAHARAHRDHAIRFEVYTGLSDGWLDVMVLGSIGLCLFLAHGLGWAPMSTAATYAMTILFLRAPMTNVVVAIPILTAGSVSLRKIHSLELEAYTPHFESPLEPLAEDFCAIHLESISYRHPPAAGEQGFALGPLNLTLRCGELVFVIGGNGSGKSTLARLLTGLYRPQTGRIRVDDAAVDDACRPRYRRMFSAVFSDFHLFAHPLDPAGDAAPPDEVRDWLEALEMGHKVALKEDGSIDTKFSQGQRKRLALMHALLERRPLLLLDEWAADQDPAFRHFFYTELLPRIRARGTTVVAMTHDDRYFGMADRILKLEGGALVEERGPAAAVHFGLNRFASPSSSASRPMSK